MNREIAVPFHFDDTGAVASVVRPEDIALGHIRTIILTSAEERLMLPQYGAGVRDALFESNDSLLAQGLSQIIADNLARWEPGINVHGVTIQPHPASDGMIEILVSYQLRADNTVQTVSVAVQGVANG